MAVIIRWITGGLVLALLAYISGHSVQRLAAEQLYDQARNASGMEKLLLSKRAIALAPESYRYHQGRAYAEQYLGRYLSHREVLRQAASLRPSWPYVWNDLLFSFADSGHLGRDFKAALSRGRVLGYNSSSLAWKRAVLALQVLDEVEGGEVREMLQEDLQRAYRSKRDKVLAYALLTRNVGVLCGQDLQAIDPELSLWCEQTPAFVNLCMGDRPRTQRVKKYCESGLHYWRDKLWRRFRLMPDEQLVEGGN